MIQSKPLPGSDPPEPGFPGRWLGAASLILVDTLARTLSNNEVPLGILTAVVGAPFFLWLLARGRRGWA